MELDGLQRMLDFLDTLEDEGVHFVIDQVDPGSLLVSFTLVGTRVEVDFYPDRMEHRVFKGSEDVHNDKSLLDQLAVVTKASA